MLIFHSAHSPLFSQACFIFYIFFCSSSFHHYLTCFLRCLHYSGGAKGAPWVHRRSHFFICILLLKNYHHYTHIYSVVNRKHNLFYLSLTFILSPIYLWYMGRKKLYLTKEEQYENSRAKSRRYYQLNREKILKRQMLRYIQKKRNIQNNQ